jgi:hypothetical protein
MEIVRRLSTGWRHMGHLWLDVCISIAQSCKRFEQVGEATETLRARADLADAKMAARQNSGVARRGHADDASEAGREGRMAKQQPRLQKHELGRLQHVTAVYFFELKSPAARSRTVRGRVLPMVTRAKRGAVTRGTGTYFIL